MNKIIKVPLAVAFVTAASYGIYANQKADAMSDLIQANIEALANGESGGSCRWSRVFDSMGCQYWNCVSNGGGDYCNCGDTKG